MGVRGVEIAAPFSGKCEYEVPHLMRAIPATDDKLCFRVVLALFGPPDASLILSPPCSYSIVSNPETDDIVSWSGNGKQFTVHQLNDFSTKILPSNFNHPNFSSFVRQLNSYVSIPRDPDSHAYFFEGPACRTRARAPRYRTFTPPCRPPRSPDSTSTPSATD